jgi:Glutathione S-transferase, N-terminal domain
MALKLHRCQNIWVKLGGHPCWRVQRELDAKGIDYEIVKHKWLGSRDEVVELTGQKKLPFIEFEDGTVLREESKDLAARIRRGKLRAQSSANGQGAGAVREPVDGT